MMKFIIKTCNSRFCQLDFYSPDDLKIKYHSEKCREDEKKARQNEEYHSKKSSLNEINRIAGLLRTCYKRYGEKPFDVNILRNMRMNWTVYTNIIKHQDGIHTIQVGSYKYRLFENDTIIIYKHLKYII